MGSPVNSRNARDDLTKIFQAAIEATHGTALVQSRSTFDGATWRYRHGEVKHDWTIPRHGRVLVIGAGKATAAMASGLEAMLGDRIDGGTIVVKYGHGLPLRRIVVLEAGHPVPDASGAAATGQILDLLPALGPDDRVFVLISGGASALLVAPVPGLSLDAKAAITTRLLRSGASIGEINAVRRQLSTVKGGGLLRAIGKAQSRTLVISDVPGNDAAMIGSGPTVTTAPDSGSALGILARHDALDLVPASVQAAIAGRGASGPVANPGPPPIVLADSNEALDAAVARARALGFETCILDRELAGDTHVAARRFAAALKKMVRSGAHDFALLAAGETTLAVRGNGRGGRCQEFALVVAREIAGVPGLAVLAAGSDGTDGPTDAAGAFVDGTTCVSIGANGLSLDAALLENDSYPLLKTLAASFRTGPTGTNVRDLFVGTYRAPMAPWSRSPPRCS